MESQTQGKQNQTQDERRKKPYSTPELLMYGNVREITQAVGSKGNADGGSGGTQKTSA